MIDIADTDGKCHRLRVWPITPGPQALNRIAPTVDEQIDRARRGRPRPSLDDRVAAVERQLASLRRQFVAAGVPS